MHIFICLYSVGLVSMTCDQLSQMASVADCLML